MEQYGKGAIKDTFDRRDYKFSDIASATPEFDWQTGFDIETQGKLTVKDQNGSSSCGGQAWSVYGQALDFATGEKSAKFIYAQTFVPPSGGSNGRDNCDLVIKQGWTTEKLTTSYMGELLNIPPTEMFMRRLEDITPQAFTEASTDKALSYAQVDLYIDSIAQAVRDNKGCIIGITGQNNGTWQTAFPLPPSNSNKNPLWHHWVYIGKCKLIYGKKYLGFLNSWGINTGDKGWQWISED